MDKFDKHVKEEVQGYLNKHVQFSPEESQQIRRKIASKHAPKKVDGVYYTVLASTIVLFIILSIPLVKTLNFTSNSQDDYSTVAENEIEDNKHIKAFLDDIVNGKSNDGSRKMLSTEATNDLQLFIMNNPEKYKLKQASLNYWSKSGEYNDSDSPTEITLEFSMQSQQSSYFTQIFKGEVSLEDNHEVIEKVGNWSLIPDSETSSNMQENKYTIAVSEILSDDEKYTIIVQTYDLYNDVVANPYSKTDILDFTESLQAELAVKKLLEIIPED